MARVHDVVLRKPPTAPGTYSDPKAALEGNPEEVVVDGRYKSEASARNAAWRVNNGERAKWPSDRYYGSWDFNAETSEWELLIGLKEHMPQGWADVVAAPGSRKGRTSSPEGGQEDEVQDEGPAEESAQGEGYFA